MPLIGLGQKPYCMSGNCNNGYGKYVWYTDGHTDMVPIIYDGQFKNGKFHGDGFIEVDYGNFEGGTSTSFIKGQWNNGRLDGNVIEIHIEEQYSTGEEYESDYEDIEFQDTYKYIGEYKDSLRNGFGIENSTALYYAHDIHLVGPMGSSHLNPIESVSTYIGQWQNDMRNGLGRYFYSNGDIYEGEWKDNKRHGRGLMIYNDGGMEEGLWENGEFIGEE